MHNKHWKGRSGGPSDRSWAWIAAACLTLMACGEDKGEAGSAPAEAAPTSNAEPTAAPQAPPAVEKKTLCALVPLAEVAKTLGIEGLGGPTAETQSSVTSCRFEADGNIAAVIVRLQDGYSAETFAELRAGAGEGAAPVEGVGESAFSLAFGPDVKSVAALHHGYSIQVTATAPLERISALVSLVASRLP